MQNSTKRPQVILVSMFNYAAFLFYFLGGRVAASNSSQDTLIIATDVVAFLWVTAFAIHGLQRSKDPLYPVVAITAVAWPSFLIAALAVAYLASLLGFNLS
jgi:hypothetical protein